MRTLAAAFALCLSAAAVSGCACAKEKLLLERADTLWGVNGPRLRKYVSEDKSLDGESRKIRLESVDRMDQAMREAKEGK